MTLEEKRMAIANVYPGLSWKTKVANMAEGQVIAVYLAFEKNGTFRKDLKKHNKHYVDKPEVKQLSVFDIMKNRRS